jgi:hypothetical protein
MDKESILVGGVPVPVVSLLLLVVLHPVGEDGSQEVHLLTPAPLLLLQVNLKQIKTILRPKNQ